LQVVIEKWRALDTMGSSDGCALDLALLRAVIVISLSLSALTLLPSA
jgi:hypothetical protein